MQIKLCLKLVVFLYSSVVTNYAEKRDTRATEKGNNMLTYFKIFNIFAKYVDLFNMF